MRCAAIIATIVADPIYALYPAFSVHSFISGHTTIETNLAIGDRVFATPRDYGAKGDAKTLADGAISSGSAIFTSSSAGFTSADVRKAIAVSGAGTMGAALVGLISVVNSVTSVTLSAEASTTVSGARADYGTDDTAAVRSCVQNSTLLGGRCTINDGARFMMSNASTTINVAGANVAGGMIDGTGTLIFAPQGPLTAGPTIGCSISRHARPRDRSRCARERSPEGLLRSRAKNPSDAAAARQGRLGHHDRERWWRHRCGLRRLGPGQQCCGDHG